MGDKGQGYVSIHREIMNHWIWQDLPVSRGQAWVDLILLANYKNEKFPYKSDVIEGKRGTVYRSISFLAQRWGWSRNKVRRFLAQLESDRMITLRAATHGTTIFIQNYEDYQGNMRDGISMERQQKGSKRAAGVQQAGSKSAAGGQQADTYNKDNNSNKGNKGNKENNMTAASEQSDEEVEEASKWFESL